MKDASAATFDNSRDRHLFGPGPKRILALDGGGVRGALTVAFLERIETLTGVPIAMVSTGAERDETILVHHPFE